MIEECLTNWTSSGRRPESCALWSFVKGESVGRTKMVMTVLPLRSISQFSYNYFQMTKTRQRRILTEREIPYAKYFPHFENFHWTREAVPSVERAFGFDRVRRKLYGGGYCLHQRRVRPPYRCFSRSPEMYCLWSDILL